MTTTESTPETLWPTRQEAYATLQDLAEYLARAEPHSPAPWLLQRAVRWGRMELPQLVAEILREEGTLQPLLDLLRVDPAADNQPLI